MYYDVSIHPYIDSATEALLAGTEYPFNTPRKQKIKICKRGPGTLSAPSKGVQTLEEMNRVIMFASGLSPTELQKLGLHDQPPAPPTATITIGRQR